MGKQQETDEFGIPIKKTATEVDEFGIPVKKKVETAPSASTSTVAPTTAPSASVGGTSGLGITPSVSQGIPSLPGRVNPQTLAPIQQAPQQSMPSNQEDEIAMQKKIEKEMGGLSIPSDEQLSKVNVPGVKQVRVDNNALGEKKFLDVSQGTTKQVDGMFVNSMTFDDKALIQDQANITADIEAKDLKGKSDYFNKVYAPIAQQKGLDLASDEATMDFYLNYLKDTNPTEYKYDLDKFNSLRDAVEEGKNTKNYAGNTKDDQLALERFEAELITKGTKLKTEAYSGFKRETKATIDNFYKDKVDNFSKLSSDGEKKISEVNSVIAELDKFPKNENGEIITDATNRKQVEQLIEKQQKLIGELETIKGGIDELKQDKDFNDAYTLMQDADARQEEVSKRYYDLATNNPEAFKNLPEYKALIESKAAAKKKKDYMESMNITSFGVGEGIGQAVTNFVSKLAYIPKSLGSDEYGLTDQMYDAASQNIQDFNDEYITTPTEMDKPLLEDGKWSLKYLPGKLAGTATDMALMILTTKGIGGATGALPLVSESVASAVGQVASGYTMSAQGYYEEAKQSGMSEADANSIAREVAILDGFLELVSPNEKLLSPFKLKDDFASYAEALAKGATKKKALAETTRKIIEKNIPENFQELLQTTNAHVMFTSNELSKANESARQSFGEEVVETVIMTTLLTTLMGGKESVTTRNRYNNEALYMAAFAPDKMMATMSKNLERGLITQEQHDALTKKITIASEALKKMGDVPQEKKIKTLPAMVEKMEEEAKKKETDAQFQAPIDEKIKTKEEEINQVLNEPSEADMLDENIAYLQELEAEGVIDDNQKEELDNLLTQKQTQNEQSQEGQVQAQEVITPVEETAPYVVDATEQRQPIELSVETPKVEVAAPVEEVKQKEKANHSIDELESMGFDVTEFKDARKKLDDYRKTIDGTNPYKTKKELELEEIYYKAGDSVREKGNKWAEEKSVAAPEVKSEVKAPVVETPTKKEEVKSEVKSVELEARFPGGMPRKMEFKDGEWKQNVGGDYTTVAPAVQEQAQKAFNEQSPSNKEGSEAPNKTAKIEAKEQVEAVKAEVVPEVKKEEAKPTKNIDNISMADLKGLAPKFIANASSPTVKKSIEDLKEAISELSKTKGYEGFVKEKQAILDEVNSAIEKVIESSKVEPVKAETKPIEVKKEAVKEPTKKEEVSGSEFSVPVNEIETDTKRFQNRKRKFSEKSVKKIVEGFDENKLDAITLWKDPADGKTYVLSGHSRLEAHKQLGKPNVKSKYFVGTEQEAKEFGRTSNVSGEQETLTERANYYRGLRKDGKKNSEIGKEAKKNEGANAIKVLSISHLNPDGALIQDIDKMEGADVRSENKLIDAANWMGDARMRNPELTDAHEQEMYDWLIKDGAIDKIKSKVEFGQRISNIVGGMFFDAKNPLNLKNKSTKGALENEVDDEINGVKSEIKELEKERDSRTKPATSKRLDEITAQVKLLNAKLGKLNEALKAAKEGDKQQVSIFDQIEEVINEKEVTDEAANEYINSTEKIDESEAVIEAIESEEKNKEGATEKELEQVISDIDKEIGEVKEKPIESNKKEDIIDKEAEAAMEADKSVKEDEKLVFEIENVNIAKLKAEKDEKMIEQRAVTAMAKAYKAWKDKKITYSTYTTLKNKIEDVVEGKVKKSKLKGRLQEEVAIQRLADVKKKVKEKLLGEGYNPSQLYSAPGINPKVINDLIDGAFNLAEKAIRAGFTIKEAVDKANKLIKSSPAYKAAVRNKQIDEKEFESKISEAVNEETEALKKAFEEEQKKKAEEKELDENTPIEGDIKTGREKERANAKMQKESGKLSEVFDRISDTNKKYKETSLSKSKEYIDTILDDFEANGELIFLAEDLLGGREVFLPEVKHEAERLLAGRLYDLAKTKINDPIAQDDILSKAAKLYTKAMEAKTLAATQTAAGRIGNEKISSSPTLLTNMIAEKITEIQKGTITPEEVKKTAEAANEINNIFDMEQMKEQMKKDIMTEFGEKTFGSKEEAERFANFSKSLLTDSNDC